MTEQTELEYVPYLDPDFAPDIAPADAEFGRDNQGKQVVQHHPSALEETDLVELFGEGGPIAQRLDGYELRPSQLEMAQAIKRSLLNKKHALIEAPTGTGKSIAYLIPAILSGKTIVVATANKSLQSQLYYKDIPFLREVLDMPISAVIVKGRSNFVCTKKWEEEATTQESFAFVDREHEQVTFLRNWLDETDTGDVDDLPFMLDGDLRPRIVSYTDDCLQRDCRHYEDNCWINKMRDHAAEAQVLITNHHLLLNALELGWAGERILPPAAIYIVDEAHQIEQTATSVFEASVTDFAVEQLLRRGPLVEHVSAEEIDELRFSNTFAFQEAANLSTDNAYRIEPELEEMKKLAHALDELRQRMKKDNPYSQEETAFDTDESNAKKKGKPKKKADSDDADAEKRRSYDLALEGLTSVVNKLLAVATNKRDENFVRYAARVFDRRHITIELHAAPINPAEMLHEHLFHPEEMNEAGDPVERTVISTSATLATKKNFEHFKQRCGLEQAGEELILPAVFDYPQQAILYQPQLPVFNFREPDPYYNAVAKELERLLEVSRGRALCLFTSWNGLQQVRDRLCQADASPIWPLRAQGDAPRDALLDWFKETPYSVMLATKSFWEGVDIPGDDLSLVVLDKMPFPTPNDPLHSARMKTIDDAGRSSFGDYMLPLMTLTLKQGFGRLVRRGSDKGVVAILDERLTSKSYGRQARNDLPPARFSRKFPEVHQFFRSALDREIDFALNVWATKEADSTRWRWQLLRLQDGKADGETASDASLSDAALGEVAAATAGLCNLRQRIEAAGRSPDQFGVEVRCCKAFQLLQESDHSEELLLLWMAERAKWKAVELVEVPSVVEQEVA